MVGWFNSIASETHPTEKMAHQKQVCPRDGPTTRNPPRVISDSKGTNSDPKLSQIVTILSGPSMGYLENRLQPHDQKMYIVNIGGSIAQRDP